MFSSKSSKVRSILKGSCLLHLFLFSTGNILFTLYITNASLFSITDALPAGLWRHLKELLFPGQLIPSDIKGFYSNSIFHMQTNQFRDHIPLLPLLDSHKVLTLLDTIPVLIIPKPGTRQLDTVLPSNFSGSYLKEQILNTFKLPCLPAEIIVRILFHFPSISLLPNWL